MVGLATAVIEHFETHPGAPIITSQPGLGALTGARVLAEIGDDRSRFADARALKAYAGAAPVTRASGKTAAAVIAAQADLVPDTAVDDLASRMLHIVEKGPPVTFGGPVRVQCAMRALGALGSRLAAAHADRLLELIRAIVPRAAGRARYTDDEMVTALAALARRSDMQSHLDAGQLLVDSATRFGIQRATIALQRLPRQEALVGPLVDAVKHGDADAAEVLAGWDVWVDPMAVHLRAAVDRLLAEPVG